jgi:glutathione synthase
MYMRFLFIMDPIEHVQIHLDSTFAMMLEAQARGHEVLVCLPSDLRLVTGEPRASVRPCTLRPVQGKHADLGVSADACLRTFDAIFVRHDPPFDMEYITATYILEAAEPDALVINRPASLRSHNEKLYALEFPDYCPESIVTCQPEQIRAFQDDLGTAIVVKPLDGNGGVAVFVVNADDPNRNVILEVSTENGHRSIIAQRYLPAAVEGDKRILLVDGAFAGAVLRIPTSSDHRGNIHVGAQCVASPLSPREEEMLSVMGPRLRADGHLFVGIDVIGDFLTEINVTSPTGIHEVNALEGRRVEAEFIDCVEEYCQNR